uniref:Uncharacterized protein n=1 Tax=Clytia hemisphaerica TaxID=252671 RepID=A0A7M6DRV9_9CNID
MTFPSFRNFIIANCLRAITIAHSQHFDFVYHYMRHFKPPITRDCFGGWLASSFLQECTLKMDGKMETRKFLRPTDRPTHFLDPTRTRNEDICDCRLTLYQSSLPHWKLAQEIAPDGNGKAYFNHCS